MLKKLQFYKVKLICRFIFFYILFFFFIFLSKVVLIFGYNSLKKKHIKLKKNITKYKGKVEEIELPVESVDIIISEWMGYFLLYESMLNSVIYARDKWLIKDGTGILMPDKSRMFVCGIEDGEYMDQKINFWDNVYGFKMPSLKEEAMKEPLVDMVSGKAVVTDSQQIFNLNLYTVKMEQLKALQTNFTLNVKVDDYIHAFVVYFDVIFSKCQTPIQFSTGHFFLFFFYLPGICLCVLHVCVCVCVLL